jgi:prolyl-tRNA editing enzyme YbaK/EbsC (Cys-tRNA(Pro) deacylase)
MNIDNLTKYISDNEIDAEFIYLDQETLTVKAAAAAVGVHPDNIGKSILFIAAEDPIMVITNGEHRLSYPPIARHLDLNRRQIKLANPEEVLQFTGYAVGTVPPFGHISELSTLISDTVLGVEELYAGGGSANALLKIKPAELVRVTNAKIAPLHGS